MKNILAASFTLLFFLSLNAQTHSHSGAQPFTYPNIDGFVTLKTDLHMHSVFSDGKVWPTI
ncbi:MAG: PHP domain-containing protein, partial [Arenibacter sp.]|nr:PHP domain-containing protein [Arenibacter sp.]